MSLNIEKLTETIQKTTLPQARKQMLLERLQNEGATPGVVNAIRQALRAEQAKKLLAMPSILESKDPEIKAANRKLAQELRQAKEAFFQELAQIEKEAEMLKNDIAEDINRLTEIVAETPSEGELPPAAPEPEAPLAE